MSEHREPGGPLEAAGDASSLPSLLLVMLGGIAVVLAAIGVIVLTGSTLVAVIAAAFAGVILLAVIGYTYSLLARTGVRGDPSASLPASEGVRGLDPSARAAACVSALRDAHAIQRATHHLAKRAAAQLPADGEDAEALSRMFAAQAQLAERHAGAVEQRLRRAGAGPSSGADHRAILGAASYEHVLAHDALTDARHAAGLARLGSASYELVDRLCESGGQEPDVPLADLRRELDEVVTGWRAADSLVLRLARKTAEDGELVITLLDDAHEMERLHAALFAVSANHAREAGIAAGVEELGLSALVGLLDAGRARADAARERLHARLRELGRSPSALRLAETLAAVRATGLEEHLRAARLARDVRDALAAGELASTTYRMLTLVSDAAGDHATRDLAEALHADEAESDERLAAGVGAAVQISLLSE